jgi:hypothetical protein
MYSSYKAEFCLVSVPSGLVNALPPWKCTPSRAGFFLVVPTFSQAGEAVTSEGLFWAMSLLPDEILEISTSGVSHGPVTSS